MARRFKHAICNCLLTSIYNDRPLLTVDAHVGIGININHSTILAIITLMSMVTLILGLINSAKTIHSSLSTINNISPVFIYNVVRATRNRSCACDNLDIRVCVKLAVLAFSTPRVRADANMSPHCLCCKNACRQRARRSHLRLLLLCSKYSTLWRLSDNYRQNHDAADAHV